MEPRYSEEERKKIIELVTSYGEDLLPLALKALEDSEQYPRNTPCVTPVQNLITNLTMWDRPVPSTDHPINVVREWNVKLPVAF